MNTLFEFLRGLRRAPRTLAGTPALSLASIATLAISIGATTAIFSVFYGVVMKPLPFHDPDALVQLSARAADGRAIGVSQVELEDWVDHVGSFRSIAIYGFNQFTLTASGDPELLRGAIISKEFFALLGIRAQIGKTLDASDDLAPHVLISDTLWRTRFGGDSAIVGTGLHLNGQLYTVVGVAPASLRYPADDVAVWGGLGYARTNAPPQWKMRGFRQFSMIARLREGATLETAQFEVDEVAQALARSYPRFSADVGAVLTRLREQLTDTVRRPLTLLFAAVLFVLLVACANLANLSLARAAAAQRDMALKVAIGASRRQLVAGVVAESTVLAVVGAIGGLAVANGAVSAMRQLIPPDVPRTMEIGVDGVSIVFTLTMTVLSLLLFGLAPALWSTRRPASRALSESMPSPARLSRLRDGLVVGEIALAVVLLVGSALLGRSFYNLMQSESGAAHADAVTVKLSLSGDAAAAPTALVDRLLAALRDTPGVDAAGIASSLPPNISQMRTSLTARDASGVEHDVPVEIVAAGGEVFRALGVPVLAGRHFSDADTSDSARVIVLSKSASEKFFPDGDAVGRGLAVFTSSGQPDTTVVGVVGDVKFSGMDVQPDAAIYVPGAQRAFRTQYLVVRAPGETSAAIQLIRKVVRSVDPQLAMSDIRTVAELTEAATARPRFQATLVSVFALLALSLASIGLYGVTSEAMAQRTREFAVRVALGATHANLFRLILSRAVLLSAIGAAVGTGLSIAMVRAITGFLFGVQPIDVLSFAAAISAVVTIGAIVAVVPAGRVMRLQPATALRST